MGGKSTAPRLQPSQDERKAAKRLSWPPFLGGRGGLWVFLLKNLQQSTERQSPVLSAGDDLARGETPAAGAVTILLAYSTTQDRALLSSKSTDLEPELEF